MSDFFLPEELMPMIWLRLPIKSTVRFRCVSKSWCASLSDLHFIYKNLTFSEAAANEQDVLLLVNMERPHYSVVSHETLLPTPLKVPPEVPLPVLVPGSHIKHVPSPPCDDMVCFYDYLKCSPVLWNLTTGETKMVPGLVLDEGSRFTFLTLGFGFDEKRKEYKIVQILHHRGKFVGYVYSLSSSNNCWRKVGEPKMTYNKRREPVDSYSRSYRDGTFYWGDYEDQIVSFDMSTEVFNMIFFPSLNGLNYGITGICKLKEGSMFVTISRANFGSYQLEYELWALLEVGVSQSWTKLLVIDGCGEDNDPFGFWRNELILRSYDSRLFISYPFKREMEEVHMDEPRDISRCFVWRKGKKNTSINLFKS